VNDLLVEPAASATDDEILDVLGAAFDRSFSPEWLQWKHREGPWGPSTGWVARDASGLVGVRLFCPWRVAVRDVHLAIGRAFDGAVHPRAQRRGVFSALVRAEMERLQRASDTALLYSTSVPGSREAYRRLGWTVLPEIPYGWRVVIPSPRSSVAVVDIADAAGARLDIPEPDGMGIRTAWTPAALRWRSDPRSGHQYAYATLRESDEANGLLLRTTTRRGVRIMFVVHRVGRPEVSDRLATSAATRLACRFLVETCGPATQTACPPLRRASSTVSLWASPSYPREAPDPATPASWRFSLADLEGVM
jgi:GNAT superfamily N-acetyltransferase